MKFITVTTAQGADAGIRILIDAEKITSVYHRLACTTQSQRRYPQMKCMIFTTDKVETFVRETIDEVLTLIEAVPGP